MSKQIARLQNIEDVPADDFCLEDADYAKLLAAEGEEVELVEEATPGYYLIRLADGTEYDAISVRHLRLIPREPGKTPAPTLDAINAYRVSKMLRTVPEVRRNGTLERHFGKDSLNFEGTVFGAARRLMPDYTGGYWYFAELAGGGFYMHLDCPTSFRMVCHGNVYEEDMSGDAAGIVVCLFVYSNLSFDTTGQFQETLAGYYHLLREYVLGGHPEASAILRAID